MTSPRHRAPRTPKPRALFGRVAAPAVVAISLTAMVVTTGVAGVDLSDDSAVTAQSRSVTANLVDAVPNLDRAQLDAARGERPTRTARRVTLQPEPVGHQWATAPLNVWRAPGEKGPRVGLIKAGTRLAVTGQVRGHWAEVLLKWPNRPGHAVRWVNNDYLADKKPVLATTGAVSGGLSGAPCPDGSSIEGGLTSNADRVYRAVCAAFPSLSSYGGRDPHGEHYDGRAIDIMISGSAGQAVADWLRANAGALQVRTLIYAQRIWTPERSGEGWRFMSDRGSTTANHYDHVHVSVY